VLVLLPIDRDSIPFLINRERGISSDKAIVVQENDTHTVRNRIGHFLLKSHDATSLLDWLRLLRRLRLLNQLSRRQVNLRLLVDGVDPPEIGADLDGTIGHNHAEEGEKEGKQMLFHS
jgi:hypothetical protein